MEKVRVDRILSKSGFGSRTDAKKLIKSGRVFADGKKVLSPAEKYVPESITVDRENVNYEEFIYILMNKPEGVISATEDKKLKTVLDLLDDKLLAYEPFPVGRLDIDTTGLLVLTNDGDLSHNLLSPKKHVEKTYEVTPKTPLSDADLKALCDGVDIGGYITKPAKAEMAGELLYLTITEGKFHQVKKMLFAVGNEVVKLKRIKFGNLTLPETLKEGEWIKIKREDFE